MTSEEKERIVSLWCEGVPVKDISDQVGYAITTILAFACRHRDRMPRRRKPVDDDALEIWLERIMAGRARPCDAARALGISVESVRIRLRKVRNDETGMAEGTGEDQGREAKVQALHELFCGW